MLSHLGIRVPVSRKQMSLAALAALALRLFFILKFPASSGDTPIYDELATNWLHHGVYGLTMDGRLAPVMFRLPGYPAFLAAVYAVLGHSQRAVMIVQALVDTATCFLVAALAARLVSGFRGRLGISTPGAKHRAPTIALWLAALCPFTANYTAVLLTEVLAVFFTTLALLLLLEAFDREHQGTQALPVWLLAGVVTGLGTLVRPETPLLMAATGMVLFAWWRRPAGWPKLARAGLLLAAGLVVTLLPWAARNWHTFREIQFLAPRYAEMPGEFVPKGFYQWTRTWLTRFPDVYTTVWKLESEPIDINDLPADAFDSANEHDRVAALLDRYNADTNYTPALDREFAEIARARTARRPLRTWVTVPLARAATIWFHPRIELLPYSGKLFPLAEEWEEDRADLLATTGFGLLGFLYAGLALFGLWRARACPEAGFFLTFLALRTVFLTQVEAPEPRYLLPAYPVILALAALATVTALVHRSVNK